MRSTGRIVVASSAATLASLAATGALAQPAAFVPLRPGEVFAHALLDIKLIVVVLLAAAITSLWVLVVRLASPRKTGRGGEAIVSVVSSAAPLLGIGGSLWVFFRLACHLARITPTPSLMVLSPGLAEGLLVAVLGFLAAVPATIACGVVRARAPLGS